MRHPASAVAAPVRIAEMLRRRAVTHELLAPRYPGSAFARSAELDVAALIALPRNRICRRHNILSVKHTVTVLTPGSGLLHKLFVFATDALRVPRHLTARGSMRYFIISPQQRYSQSQFPSASAEGAHESVAL